MKKSDLILINLIKHFYLKKIFSLDSIELLAPEVTYAENKKRADLILIKNNEIIAIEIKSQEDSLSKLAEQIKYYTKNFHKTYILVTENHLQNTYKLVKNTKIGILLQKKDLYNNLTTIEVYKEASSYINLNKYFLISLINKNSYKNIIFEDITLENLITMTLKNLKDKYLEKFNNFKKEISNFEDFFFETQHIDQILAIYNITYKNYKYFKYL
jgi:hypothetical protein